MTESEDQVRRLAAVTGISATADRSYDWQTIEAGLGMGLPPDYKLIADSFPDGWFRMFAQVRLPDSATRLLNDYALDVMDTVRELRAEQDFADLDFPFPAYPEPGGLLLCGTLRCPGYMFWVSGPGDPGKWPLVLAHEEYSYWERFDGSLCDFLTEVALGRFDASGFPDDFGWHGQDRIDIASRPAFGRDEPRKDGTVSPPAPPVPARGYWGRLFPPAERPAPENEMPALREMIGPPAEGVPAVDWDAVHARLGLVLPSDYREFIDAYGPGKFGEVKILSPGGRGEWDLFGLLERRHAQVQGAERDPRLDVPCHPEAGGVVSWGVTDDGRTLAWAPADPDPDRWVVALIRANRRMSMERLNDRTSFSSLLRYYAEHDDARDLLSIAYPWNVEVRFTPAETT